MRKMLFSFLFCLGALHAADEPPPFATFDYNISGMFSSFKTVIGMLERYEQGEYAGIEVNFYRGGCYYEPKLGENWWRYYFEPLRVGSPKNGNQVLIEGGVAGCELERLAAIPETLPHKRCKELIDKYIKLRPEMEIELQDFITRKFGDNFVIGVHFRGTDKFGTEAEPISYQEMLKEIDHVIQEKKLDTYKIFLATDEQDFFDAMIQKYKDKVVFFDIERAPARTSSPLHRDGRVNNYIKGKYAVLDCLALSRCSFLVRTASNLSEASTYFNPELPYVVVNYQTKGS